MMYKTDNGICHSLRRADTDSTIEMFFEDYETYDGKNDTPMIGFSNSTY